MSRTGSLVGRAVSWLVIVAAATIVTATVLLPRLAGATPYTVLTGSMRPAFPPGTLVVVKPVAWDDIGVGDVVTYQLRSGRRSVVTHRVASVGIDAEGRRVLWTKGDANHVTDVRPVREVQVRGGLWYAVPYLGYVNNLLTGQQRQRVIYALAAMLMGYAAITWGSALRSASRRHEEVPDAEEAPHAPSPA